MDIVDPRIASYLAHLQPEHDPRLQAMEEKARSMHFPIIDRQVGRFLHLITLLKKPRLVVELGSGFGYSALWIARALQEGTQIVLTEYAERNLEFARRLFAETGLADKAVFRAGNALDLGQEYDNIDMLFIDVDKYLYPEALSRMLPRLAPDGLLVADNALWRGRVVESDPAKDSEPVKEFNKLVSSRGDFFTTIVPVGDGVLLAQRVA